MRFESAILPGMIATAAVVSMLSLGCASTATSTNIPFFTGHVSVPSGATAALNDGRIALGLDATDLTPTSAENLPVALKRLRAQHNKAALESFQMELDTLALRIAPTATIENVRRLIAASRTAGFSQLAVVGQTPSGQVTALKLLSKPPSSRGATHLALRWGTRKTRSKVPKKTDGTAVAGIEVATIESAGKPGTRSSPRYAVQRGENVDGEPTCPAVPLDTETLEPKLTAVVPIAQRACQQSEAGNAIFVSPSPATSWGEVLSVANAASSAKGCRSALFIEPEATAPVGCNSFLAKVSDRRTKAKKASKLLGLLSGSGQLSKALIGGSAGSLVLGKGTGGLVITGGGRVVGLRGGGGNGGGGSIGGGRVVPRPPTGMLIMGTPTITGSCDKSIVKKVLRLRLRRMRQCFRTVAGRGGTLDLQLAIDSRGKVNRASIISKGPASAAAGTCVIQTARRLRFPRPADQRACGVDVRLSFKRPPPPKRPSSAVPAAPKVKP